MTQPAFPAIEPIRYEGPDTSNPLAFRVYDPDRIVADKRMEDHLRIAVCYWHSFNWPGSDVFGDGTFDRPWLGEVGDEMDAARRKMDAAFEFFSKLGTPYFCFHDRDIAPDGADYRETVDNLHAMVDYAAKKMEQTGVELLWGTANLFSHPRFAAGAATNPDPEIFAFAAAQVRQALDATHRLGGTSYVLWGGREGFTEFRLDKAKEVAAAVMPRRGREFTPAVAEMFEYLFERTRVHREESPKESETTPPVFRVAP